MKKIVLCGITLLAVAPAFAQTSASATADQASKTVTLTGCVGGSADSSGFTLGNAMVIPGTAQPGQIDQTPSTLPPTVPSPPTQATAAAPVPPPSAAAPVTPPSAAAAPTQVPPPASTAQVPPRASAAQVPSPASGAQVGATAGSAVTAGTAGTTPPSVTGTTGVVAGGATPNTTSGLGGYRLSGTDMKPWAGQRVLVVGVFTPSPATAAGTSSAPAAPPLELRVQSVQPASGPCPK